MSKPKHSLFSLSAHGTISRSLTYLKRLGHQVAEKKPELKDIKTEAQLDWRHMFNKAVALWHVLSAAEKDEWESAARPRHMTGYAWFISQALRPNPGIYLPLQGGTMQGAIDMAGFAINTLKDPLVAQDADTKAARDAAIAAAIGGSLTCDIYGYDGANWQKLLVESAAQHNLRVKLFDGANGIDSDLLSEYVCEPTQRGLIVNACLREATTPSGTFREVCNAAYGLDARSGGYMLATGIYGFDGANWERLRTYDTGILKVAKGAISPNRIRMTATGRVGVAGAKKLFWIACSPDSPAAEWELTDADAGGGAVVYDHFDSDRHSEQIDFDPPMEFATGIWVDKFDHMKSLVFCYK